MLPSLTSVKAVGCAACVWYKNGATWPIGGSPSALRASLKSEIIAAITGVEALVPLNSTCRDVGRTRGR